MPRDGTGIYSRPLGIDAVPDTTIESSKYNLNVADVEQDLNTPRPVVAGGTGGSTPDQARGGLQAEKAAQVVVNFDAHIWFPGSFRHAKTAANVGQPVIDHAFDGVSYTADAPGAAPDYIPLNQNVTVEARDLDDTVVPGRCYVREKKAGLWSAWKLHEQYAIDTKVDRAGDTMTGGLTMKPPAGVPPTIVLNKQAATLTNDIWGHSLSAPRWLLRLGDEAVEGGGPTGWGGSDFKLISFNNDGTAVAVPLAILRSENRVTLSGDPIADLHAVPKRYVDAAVATIAAGMAINLSIKVTEAPASCLTVELKTQAGLDPSPTNPVTVAFKDPLAEGTGAGIYLPLLITAPVTMVLNAGSTMGIGNNRACRLWVGLFNINGVPRLGLINCLFVNTFTNSHVLGLKESGFATLTAEAGNADIYHTWYGAVGGSGPYRVIGSVTWEDPNRIASSGIWRAPSTVDTITANTIMPGGTIQARSAYTAGGSTTSELPILVANSQIVIAPKSSANLIFVSYSAAGAVTAGGAGQNTSYQSQIFRDTTTMGPTRTVAVISASGTNVTSQGSVAYNTSDLPMTLAGTTYQLYHWRVGSAGTASTTEITAQVLEVQS